MNEQDKLTADPNPGVDDVPPTPVPDEDAPLQPDRMDDSAPVEPHEHVQDAAAEDAIEGVEPAPPVVQPRLVVKRAGQETDEVFPFACPAVIGRFDPSVGPIDVDLGNIEEANYVSRKHARIFEEDGVFKIADMGSSNGTYVYRDGDFQKVDEAEIESGLEIALGNARLVFYV